jgi:phosphonate metabolism protein (transferase hexapeptide repeat family)
VNGGFVARLSPEPFVREGCEVLGSRLGSWTDIGERNQLENAEVGDYSYTGPYCFLQNCVVGKFANIAAAVRIGPTRHPMERPTLHHFTYRSAMYGFSDRDDEGFFSWRSRQVARVGHDTWIGHGAVVMPGVSVGNGAVVGSLSVVTRDVPAYSIAVGSPARVIKLRFPEELSRRLERIAWWDWDHDTLRERLGDFRGDAAEFARRYDPERRP